MPRTKRNEKYYDEDGKFDRAKYNADNKERIRAQIKAKGGERFECECGAVTRRDKRAQHKRSKRHITTMAKIKEVLKAQQSESEELIDIEDEHQITEFSDSNN